MFALCQCVCWYTMFLCFEHLRIKCLHMNGRVISFFVFLKKRTLVCCVILLAYFNRKHNGQINTYGTVYYYDYWLWRPTLLYLKHYNISQCKVHLSVAFIVKGTHAGCQAVRCCPGKQIKTICCFGFVWTTGPLCFYKGSVTLSRN